MSLVYILCFALTGLSALAWIIEARPAFIAIRTLKVISFSEKMSYPFIFLYHMIWGARLFWIDIIVTSILVSGVTIGGLTIGFSFGGVIGTAMGLLISDIFSAYLLYSAKEKKRYNSLSIEDQMEEALKWRTA